MHKPAPVALIAVIGAAVLGLTGCTAGGIALSPASQPVATTSASSTALAPPGSAGLPTTATGSTTARSTTGTSTTAMSTTAPATLVGTGTISLSVAASTPASTPSAATTTSFATRTLTAPVTVTDDGSSTTSTAPTTVKTGSATTIGPAGFGTLRLGMTASQARATGYFASTPVEPGCSTWKPAADSPLDYVVFSQKVGVAAIAFKDGVDPVTAEGVGVGMTAQQVHRIYPSFAVSDAHQQDGGPRIAVPGEGLDRYQIMFNSQDRVSRIAMQLADQDCFD